MTETGRGEPSSVSEIKSKIANLICYDPGINQRREFYLQKSIQPLIEEPVQIYTRSALLAENLDYFKENPNGQLTILKFDIANFHAADLARDEKGNSAGDLVLNRFARRINEIASEHKDKPKIKVNSGRYGGDEFAISIFGDYSDELINQLKRNFDESFPQEAWARNPKFVYGYFKKGLDTGALIEEQRVRLKKTRGDETIEVIKRPEAEFERKIFDYFLGQGLTLNTVEISKIKKKYSTSIAFDKYIAENENRQSNVGVKDKLDNIIKKHPRIGKEIQRLLSTVHDDREKLEILSYSEERLFDRLLGDIVLSPSEFIANLPGYKKIYCLDLKLIKELNDNLSYIDGDLAIRDLWKKIKNGLGEDLGKVEISRRGGSFFIGIKNQPIFPGAINKFGQALTSIKSVKIDEQNSLKVGFASVDLDTNEKFYTQKFGELIFSAENQFYLWLVDYLTQERKTNGPIYPGLDFVFPQSDISERRRLYFRSLDGLVNHFFISKRAFRRSSIMLNLLKKQDFSSSKYDRLKSAIELINKDSFGKEMSEEGLKMLGNTVVAALL